MTTPTLTATHTTAESLIDSWESIAAATNPPIRGFVGAITMRQTAGFLISEGRHAQEPDPLGYALDIAVTGHINAPREVKPYWAEVVALLSEAIQHEKQKQNID